MEPEKAYQIVKSIKSFRLENNVDSIPYSYYQDLIDEFGYISLETVNDIWHYFDVAVASVLRRRKARYTQGHSINV